MLLLVMLFLRAFGIGLNSICRDHGSLRGVACATIEKRRHVPAFEFDERRHCGLAGQGKVGVEAVAEPFNLQAVPGQDVKRVQRRLGRRELVNLAGEQTSRRSAISGRARPTTSRSPPSSASTMLATLRKPPVTMTGMWATLRPAPENATKYASRARVLARGPSSPSSFG
jgi:hypothetical protein